MEEYKLKIRHTDDLYYAKMYDIFLAFPEHTAQDEDERKKRIHGLRPLLHPTSFKRNYGVAWEVFIRNGVVDDSELSQIADDVGYSATDATVKTAIRRHEEWRKGKDLAEAKSKLLESQKNVSKTKDVALDDETNIKREYQHHMEELSAIATELRKKLAYYHNKYARFEPLSQLAEAEDDEMFLEILVDPVAQQLYSHISDRVNDFDKHQNWGELQTPGITVYLLKELRVSANTKEFKGQCLGCPKRSDGK